MGAAPHHRQGIAAGVLATARNVGMVLGVGLAGAIFTTLAENQANMHAATQSSAFQVSFLVTVFIAAAGALVSAFYQK
jgi:MFS family permease